MDKIEAEELSFDELPEGLKVSLLRKELTRLRAELERVKEWNSKLLDRGVKLDDAWQNALERLRKVEAERDQLKSELEVLRAERDDHAS